MMKSFGFADVNGYEIDRGKQMTDREARDFAQKAANVRGVAVSYWDESSPMNEDPSEGVIGLVTVEPVRPALHIRFDVVGDAPHVVLRNFDGSERQRRIVEASAPSGWRVCWGAPHGDSESICAGVDATAEWRYPVVRS